MRSTSVPCDTHNVSAEQLYAFPMEMESLQCRFSCKIIPIMFLQYHYMHFHWRLNHFHAGFPVKMMSSEGISKTLRGITILIMWYIGKLCWFSPMYHVISANMCAKVHFCHLTLKKIWMPKIYWIKVIFTANFQ